MDETKSLLELLIEIQGELKVNKAQTNTFGNYNYRSAEDILEAAKPLCNIRGVALTLSDHIELIGERYYVMSTAAIRKDDKVIEVTAGARESLTKKGMDESQITGATSSYARKYALNGLFAIDDTKDADTDEHAKTTGAKATRTKTSQASPTRPASAKQKDLINIYLGELNIPADVAEKIMAEVKTSKQASYLITQLKERIVKKMETTN